MSKKIRFGVIGTNNITEWFLNGAKHVKDFELTAVYSRTEERAKKFAANYDIDLIFTDLNEMAKSNEIDAVYIASPNSMHAKQSILFLNNKKHVLCEKAFASNYKEVEEMVKAAEKNNVILMEAMKTVQLPGFKVIKDNLHRIGKIRRYFASNCQYSSRYDKYKAGEILNAFKLELSNGALMDIGVYAIYPMVVLFGEPKSQKTTGYILESGVDGQGTITFEYEEMDAIVQYSKISNSYIPSEIQGEDGSIIIEKINSFEKITLINRNGVREDLSVNKIVDDMCYELKEFITLIKENRYSEVNSLENSKIVMKIMDNARAELGIIYPADKSNS